MDIEVISKNLNDGYLISITKEIKRVLKTQKGSIPMNPEYGSELYKLRDRTINDETKLKIISFTFEAIDKWVDRVKCKRVEILPKNDKEFIQTPPKQIPEKIKPPHPNKPESAEGDTVIHFKVN